MEPKLPIKAPFLLFLRLFVKISLDSNSLSQLHATEAVAERTPLKELFASQERPIMPVLITTRSGISAVTFWLKLHLIIGIMASSIQTVTSFTPARHFTALLIPKPEFGCNRLTDISGLVEKSN